MPADARAPPCAQAIWKPRGSLPKVNSTVLSATMPSATVAISQAFEPRRANGRTASQLDEDAVGGAQRERDEQPQRTAASPSLHREGVGEHRAEHHRAALREVHRADTA